MTGETPQRSPGDSVRDRIASWSVDVLESGLGDGSQLTWAQRRGNVIAMLTRGLLTEIAAGPDRRRTNATPPWQNREM